MATWLNLIAVAAGGAFGSVARYLIMLGSAAVPGGSSMIGTAMANVIGCAALGALVEYTLADGLASERTRLAIQVGFLGGLTTFSTFAGESATLAANGRWLATSAYLAANLVLGWMVLLASAAAVRLDGYQAIHPFSALSEMSLRHQAPFQRMHLTAV